MASISNEDWEKRGKADFWKRFPTLSAFDASRALHDILFSAIKGSLKIESAVEAVARLTTTTKDEVIKLLINSAEFA